MLVLMDEEERQVTEAEHAQGHSADSNQSADPNSGDQPDT